MITQWFLKRSILCQHIKPCSFTNVYSQRSSQPNHLSSHVELAFRIIGVHLFTFCVFFKSLSIYIIFAWGDRLLPSRKRRFICRVKSCRHVRVRRTSELFGPQTDDHTVPKSQTKHAVTRCRTLIARKAFAPTATNRSLFVA